MTGLAHLNKPWQEASYRERLGRAMAAAASGSMRSKASIPPEHEACIILAQASARSLSTAEMRRLIDLLGVPEGSAAKEQEARKTE